MADPMPRPDPAFHTFFTGLQAWCVDNGVTYGLTAPQVSGLTNAYDPWNTSWTAHQAAQSAARAATADKDAKRSTAEPLIRTIVGILQKNTLMTDAIRAELDLTIADTTRTRAAVPTTRPALMIDNSQRLQMTVNFRDESTPASKKKPDGVMGCEIRYFCGETPPADPEDYEFAAIDTATPYLLAHESGHGGMKAHVVGRWVNTRGEKGPWSETVMATVSA